MKKKYLKTLNFILQQKHMATNRPQGDLVGWRINTKHFQLGKIIEISPLDKKHYPTNAGCGIRAHNLSVTQWGHNTKVNPPP